MPVDRDVVLAKVDAIERCLRRIEQVTGRDPRALDDQDREDIFVLNLQRAAQAAIDLANHLVAADGLQLPTKLRESFELLERHASLPKDLCARMGSMVGFRNIAVHDYQAIDKRILAAILESHLDDLRRFSRYALGRAGIAD